MPDTTMSAPEPDASLLLARTLVWDNHSCMPLRSGDERFLPQLERAREAGFDVVSLNIGFGEQGELDHVRTLAWFRRWLKARPEQYLIVDTADDVVSARATDRVAITFDIEGAGAIGQDVSLVELYYDLGVRWMLMAYNKANLAGGGCYDQEDTGLTPLGREIVREMNRTGMVVCCSHASARTVREVMEVSRVPVIFSHSNCASVHPHARNISDDMIRACARMGGVVGIDGIGDFLGPPGIDLVDALVRHVDHVAQLVGPDHVGLSFDYVYDQQELLGYLASMPETFPEAYSEGVPMLGPEALPAVVRGLIARGYDEAALQAILGGNWMRVAREVWR
jgi:membrane dipeptidase